MKKEQIKFYKASFTQNVDWWNTASSQTIPADESLAKP